MVHRVAPRRSIILLPMPRHRAPAEAEEDADEEEPLEEDEEIDDEEEEEEEWVRLSTRARHMATGPALSAVDVAACSRKRPHLAGGVEERPQEVVGAMASPRRRTRRRRRKTRTTTMTSLSSLVVRKGDETKARPCGRALGPASTCCIDWRTESTGAGLTARQRKLHGVPAGVGNIVPRFRVIAPTQVCD
jgi:hypothetical protein